MMNISNIISNSSYQEDLRQVFEYIKLNNISNKSFLITGASGLIGSFVVDSLVYYNRHVESNCRVKIHCLSRSLKKLQTRFGYCTNEDNLNIHAMDICDFNYDTEDVFDYIIHSASNSDPAQFASHPVNTITSNVMGIQNLLEYARRNTHTKVIYLSSQEVYGKTEKTVRTENHYGLIDFNQLRMSYPESKRISELLCRSYNYEYDVNVSIARLGYIYGASMTNDDSKVIAEFIRKAINREEVILKSKGEQKRSYCYISDAVLGLLYILFKGNSGEAYNVGNSNSITTIRELADIASEYTSKVVKYELPNDNEQKGYGQVMDAIIDESKLSSLGWTPCYGIKNGFRRTVDILKLL